MRFLFLLVVWTALSAGGALAQSAGETQNNVRRTESGVVGAVPQPITSGLPGAPGESVGKLDSLLAASESAYKEQPNDERLQAWIGLLLQAERGDEARKVVDRHAKRMRNRALFYTADEAYVCKKMGRTEDFAAAMKSAAEGAALQPGNASPLSDRFKSYGLFAEAVAVLEAAERAVLGMRFTYQKVLLWADLGDLPNVYRGYVQLLDENPGFVATLQMFLSNSLDENGRIPRAELLYDALIGRLQLGNSSPHEDFLVWCYIQEQLFDDALVQLKALDRRSGGEPVQRLAIYQLGRAAENAEQWDAAEQCYGYLIQAGVQMPFARESHEAIWSLQGKRPERHAELRRTLNLGLQPKSGWPAGWEPSARLALAQVLVAGWNRSDSAASVLKGIPDRLPDNDPLRGSVVLFLGDLDLLLGAPFSALMRYAEVAQDFGGNPLGDEAAFRKARVAYLTGDIAWAKTQWEVLKTSTSKKIANDALARTQLLDEILAEDSTGASLRPFARAELLRAERSEAAAGRILDSLTRALPPSNPLYFHTALAWARWNRDQGNAEQTEAAYRPLVDWPERHALGDDALWEWAQIVANSGGSRADEARALYLRLMETYPDSYWSELARQRYRPGPKTAN